MNNNIIAKLVGSIIAVVIMGFIVFFVFQYYDNEAKKPKNNGNNSNTEEEEPPVVDDLVFIDYDFNRVDIFLNKTRVVIEVVQTDAGEVLSVNDEAVYYVNSLSKAKYVIFGNYLIFDIVTDDMENIFLIDENLNIVNSYHSIINDGNRYLVSKPVVTDKFSSSIVVNDKIYVTYVIDNFGNMSFLDDEVIQLTYIVKTDGSEELYNSYKYSDIKK